MNRLTIPVVFAIGLIFVGWVGLGFVGTSWLALVMTIVIAGVYVLGNLELKQFRAATASLKQALANIPEPLSSMAGWLNQVHPSLQNAVRLRIEGERVALPGLALTPYLVGLLVMLGMLGTFLGMVVTFKGAVFALEGSTDLQAIRSALAAPIKGLGLSFGTSVAGVAASAMLGLISAMSRRERIDVARQLDTRIATDLRAFSRAYQREESFKAMQAQALALPQVAQRLQAMMEQMDTRDQQLNAQLTSRQEQFHREVSIAYTDLAATVGKSLHDSLASSSKLASDMLVHALEQAVQSLTSGFEQRSTGLLTALTESAATSQAHNIAADTERLHAWIQALESTTATQQSEWKHAGEQTLASQQAILRALESTSVEISKRTSHAASQAMAGVSALLERCEALISSRIDTEAQWSRQQGERMDHITGLWRKELGALRDDETVRGQAAVERLGQLQEALARQLATLGTALEEPLSRLMATASEAPRAAAELIGQLRHEMTLLSERDNLALQERTSLMGRLSAILEVTDKTASEQRAAIESLVSSAAAVLDKAGNGFVQMIDGQLEKAVDVSAHVSASAIELSSLGESFHLAVKLFTEANDKMIASLQRVEGAVSQSMERSDEQLAYYVGQAREVIDLSLSSQRAVVEDLRRLHSKQLEKAEAA